MIVITTPTGSVGRQVLEAMVGRGKPLRVIAREPERIPQPLRANIEVLAGSHRDASVVDRAFRGADTVFWLVPPDFRSTDIMADYVEFSRPAADAIRRQGVRRVVAISALGRGTPWAGRAGQVTALLAMCDLLAGTGVDFRALTLPGFMDNMLLQTRAIRDRGAFFLPYPPALQLPMCSSKDVAAAAVELLCDRTWSGQGEVAVLGPEDLSYSQVAEILSDALGRPIRYQPISIDAYRDQLKSHGASDAMANALADMLDAKSHGLDNAVVRTPENSSPTSYRTWCETTLKPAVMGLAA
jgi:uncharacterized protein YbjT (DUF2867 family)